MWNIFVISYFVLHSLCLIILLFNWRRIKFNKKVDEYNDFISVIIACRNEEENITKIIESINLQDYPVKNFEVIIVDDHST
ncbi:MAG TPA: glycosyltransferase family 2 protein, partial [Cyclobacteriaceae bacterium]